jgi:Dolichyl-phosphate-mannose-protein mannosyltransferase
MEFSSIAATLRPGEILKTTRQQSVPTKFLDARTGWLIAIFVAVLHALMAITVANTKSPTFDEPQHLIAGYSYWVRNDFRLDPENGNLTARWAALPLLFSHAKFISLDNRAWQRADEGGTAHQFLYEVGNDPERMIADARLMISIFGAALCFLIFRIAREFFGIVGGLIAEIVAAFDPNFLAHSALVTADVAATFFFTATIWSCGRFVQEISLARLVTAVLSLSGLFLTKFSAPIVLPVLGFISIWQLCSQCHVTVRLGTFQATLSSRWKKACAIVASSVLVAATVFFAIWLSFSFRYSAWTGSQPNDDGTTWHWNYLLEDHGAFENTIRFMRDRHFLPEAYLYGLAYVHKQESDRPAFLDNEWSVVGFHSFFPRAFLYKTPLPLLALLALTLFGAFQSRKEYKSAQLLNPFALFAALYAVVAISSQLNIGHRHLLPIYPTLFIACGAVASFLKHNRALVFGAAVLLSWQIGESLAARPNYLTYFNETAGGPDNGYQHLVDSSLDWGQDLPGLKSWIDNYETAVDAKPLYLAYFGTADPRWYGIHAKLIMPDNKSNRPGISELGPGIYFISATTLQSVYAGEPGPWCAPYELGYQSLLGRTQRGNQLTPIANEPASLTARRVKDLERLRFERLCACLRHQKPLAQVGHSIFVYDLNQEGLNHALYGPAVELRPKIWVNGL